MDIGLQFQADSFMLFNKLKLQMVAMKDWIRDIYTKIHFASSMNN